MMPPDVRRHEDPQRQLEQAFIDEFVRARGVDPDHVRELPAEQALPLMRDACKYAASKLAEVECRAHYLDDLHR